jgi:cytochrome c
VKQLNLQRIVMAVFAIWTISALLVFPRMSTAAGAESGDATRGKQLFERRCTGCHSLEKNKEGPKLGGVYGRKSGSVADFNYSDALKGSHIEWDERSLDRWLTDPDTVVPDNDMAFHVSSAAERADIIQFLRISSGK